MIRPVWLAHPAEHMVRSADPVTAGRPRRRARCISRLVGVRSCTPLSCQHVKSQPSAHAIIIFSRVIFRLTKGKKKNRRRNKCTDIHDRVHIMECTLARPCTGCYNSRIYLTMMEHHRQPRMYKRGSISAGNKEPW